MMRHWQRPGFPRLDVALICIKNGLAGWNSVPETETCS